MYPRSSIETLAVNPFVATAILAVVGIIFLLALKDRRYVLFGYLFFLPMMTMPIVSGRLAGIPGLSVQNLMMAMGLYAIFSTRTLHARMDRNLRVALILYWVVVTATVMHGLFYLDDLTRIRFFNDFGIYEYLRTYLIIPFLTWLSFVAAYRYACTSTDRTKEYLRYVGVATLGYASIMLGSVAYYFAQFRDFNLVRDMVGNFLGSHSNEYSTAFVMIAPFLLAGIVSSRTIFRDRLLFSLALMCSVAAVLFSYSRTGYVGLALTAFGFALLVKRSLLWILVPALAGLVLFGPASVIERAQFGFKSDSAVSRSTSSLDYVSAGRISMAEASLKKITSDIGQTFFGGGRLTFPRFSYDKFGVNIPHNAYLEVLLDAGIVGFIPVIILFFMMFSRSIAGMRRMRTSEFHLFYTAAAVSLGTYFIMATAGKSFFPSHELIFVWQVSGFALGLLRYDMLRVQKMRTPIGNQSTCVV